MKVIKDIIHYMDSTLTEAHSYYNTYIIYMMDQPKVASTSLEMARTHLELYTKWHNCVVNLINEYRSNKGDAPDEMKAIWNYEHEKLTEEYNELKFKILNA